MGRCVILCGGEIKKFDRIIKELKEDDYIIAADSGQKYLPFINRQANLTVGDFDSFSKPEKGEVISLPCEKDDTDTVFAIKEGLRRGYKVFLLLGATGGRMDHALGNLYALLYIKQAGATGYILDDYCSIQPVNERAVVESDYPFFSLIAVSGRAEGITITGAKYPLNNGVIEPCCQYGISNEVLPGKTAVVTVKSGELFLIKSAD